MILSKKSATSWDHALNHDDFGLNPSKIIKLIDSKGSELDAGGKPVSTFPHPAFKCPISIYPAFTGTVRCTDARKTIDEILTKCGSILSIEITHLSDALKVVHCKYVRKNTVETQEPLLRYPTLTFI
jgi:hypothetical protein